MLGVERGADAKTIKRAFLKKARVLHPDVSNEPDAEERFKELNEAYSVLSDDTKRANYDRFGDPDGPAGFGGMGGMDDFFGGGFDMSDIFSDFFGGRAASAGRARTRGRDMSVTLNITLEQAAAGFERTITYDRLAPCEDCGGTGSADGEAPHTCPECHGTGYVVGWQHTILGRMQTQTTCPECHGTGQVIEHPCETCEGQGRTPSREKVTISVPAGVDTGAQLVIEGAGEAGIRGDAAGDLVVRIDVAQSDRFVRQGNDLFCPLSIDAFEAMLGATVTVDGILEGEKVEVQVPAGTQPGARLVSAGHGMPRLRTPERRGDLVCVVDVVVPQDLTDDEVARLEELALGRGCRLSAQGPSGAEVLDEVYSQNRRDTDVSDALGDEDEAAEKTSPKNAKPKKQPPKPKRGPFSGRRRKKKR